MSLSSEIARATNAENMLQNSISLNTAVISNVQGNANSSALVVSQGILASQSSILSANTMAIAALQLGMQTQSVSNSGVTSSITALQSSVSAATLSASSETNRAQTAENALAQLIATNASNINSAATGAFVSSCNNFAGGIVTAESNRALSAEMVLTNNVSAERTRALAAEVTLTANSMSASARAIGAEMVLTNALAAQAALIVTLKSAITALTTQVNTITSSSTSNAAIAASILVLTGKVSSASDDAIAAQQRSTLALGNCAQNTTTLNNIYNSGNGTLTCTQLNWTGSLFAMRPIFRSEFGGSSNTMGIYFDDPTRLDVKYGMYIASDGHCFMTDPNDNHQIAVQH